MVSQQQMPDVFAKLIHDYIRPRTQRWSVVIMGMPTKYFIDIDKATEHFENECYEVPSNGGMRVDLYEEKLRANKWDMKLLEASQITPCACCGDDVEGQCGSDAEWEWLHFSGECWNCEGTFCAECSEPDCSPNNEDGIPTPQHWCRECYDDTFL
jgi:hypothetical protein